MRRTVRTALSACVVTLVVPAVVAVAPAGAAPPTGTLVPIGGGYERPSLEGFSRIAAEGASGPTVDLVVVPSSYGDKAKDRAENLALAQQRTDQIDAICDSVVPPPYTGCTATLAVLLNRKDAMNPANSTIFDAPSTDGIYVLGGDQGIAMQVLAGSPAEQAMERAVTRGVALGGTSAGAAVESRNMINGFTGKLGPADGLRQGSTLMWWGDDPDLERGLSFGSQRAIFDQHFYQRGRFGRLLSTIATSDERYAGQSRLGVGVDYATGVRADDDTTLSGVFGASSAAVVDFETLNATHQWVGPLALLSARNVLTHLLTPGTAAYDMTTRTPSIDGAPVAPPAPTGWRAPSAPGTGTTYLGGGLLDGAVKDGALPDFVRTASAGVASPKQSRIVVVSASSGDTATAQAYAAALKTAGWAGSVVTSTYGPGWTAPDLAGAAGVVVTAADATTLAPAMGDASFRSWVGGAARTAPAFLADDHMAAAVGARWSPKADPTSSTVEDQGIAAFRADDAQWQPGLGLVSASIVPSLTSEYRWGRLYAATMADPTQLAFGVADGTAVALSPGAGARVAGGISVVVADGRQATYSTASNGAIGAVNVVLDVFAAGEALTSAR
ncbi:Type 1 glutamine amidotransferase-like domain-containing protein [Knoellia koreensis]|uniref:Type 1 glutamine amidotransferase-like domain-containing protein n=1 Tax=Knoellia koreensis TaxID=2730921 RepID=A0A849HGX4_9MICO|nr:Type 1 glutamine amidotransferase-like domain-containing protein [Knoellia sp. DB2414S]NNM46502.1 type 1 glutamine amidotransferase-like domain-containing protein [Knoellia sp. DB2414S]